MLLRIVAAIVDIRQITLYGEDGSVHDIPQGDPRVQMIVDEVLPIVQQGGIAQIDLSLVAESSDYNDFQEKTGGMFRFFKVAKQALKTLFSNDDEQVTFAPTGSYGAIQEILDHAMPIVSSDPVMADDNSETIIAMVGEKIIPGVEQIKDQFKNSRLTGSTKGMENLLRRLAAIIETRSHSVEDVLRFLEKGDLPIADDGSIIAYKMLNRKGETFYDIHTGKVPQHVGSYVMVNEALVDRDRRNDCSNGLHIARRGYLRSFSGDVCVMAKIAPEDVVTVPHGDPNKVRVCGYHIIFELDDEAKTKLVNNMPMTDNPKAQQMLAKAIAGDHIGKIEEVRINGQKGTNIIVTPLIEGAPAPTKPEPTTPLKPARALDDVDDLEETRIDPKEVNKSMAETKVKSSKASNPPIVPQASQPVGRKAIAQDLEKKLLDSSRPLQDKLQTAQILRDHKKKSKVSWDVLGVKTSTVGLMETVLKDEEPPVKASKKTKAVSSAFKTKK